MSSNDQADCISTTENTDQFMPHQFFLNLLCKCKEAIKYEELCHKVIADALLLQNISKNSISGTPHLLVAENQLLLLASYQECTDGILYAIPLIIETSGSLSLYIRCFETGIYKGFFRANWKELFNEVITQYNIKDCFVINIFNDWDIEASCYHRTSTRKGNNSTNLSKVFKSITVKNQTSLNNYLPIANAMLKKAYGSFSLGYVIYCHRKASNTKVSSNPDNWYFKVDGLGATDRWEKLIKDFSVSLSDKIELDIDSMIQSYNDEEVLSMEHQFTVLSSCPNFHHWVVRKSHGVKKDEYFLSKGNSPRNLILRSLSDVNDNSNYILSLLDLILKKKYHIDTLPQFNRNKRNIRVAKKVQIEANDILEYLGIDDSQFEQMKQQNFDENSGTWKFYSPFPRHVSSESEEPLLTKNCINRQYLKKDENPKFFPSCDSNLCRCNLEWRKDDLGNPIHEFDCYTTLYTKSRSVLSEVYMLVCVNRLCVYKWNGRAEYIYRISSKVCAGEELCWDYIDMCTSMKCNFSAYCNFMTSSYRRHQSSKPFMSSKTFIKLFFSWASHQQDDFRVPCNWCRFEPDILACDATKIGILQKNLNVTPIENGRKDETRQTKHRRNNRCFLSYPIKTDGETIVRLKQRERTVRECRVHLKLITSSVGGSINQQKVSTEQLQILNQKLLDNVPAECKPLLERVIYQRNITVDQLNIATRMFYILSFDAPLRAFLPSKILSPLSNYFEKALSVDEIIKECKKFNPIIGDFIYAFRTSQEQCGLDRDALSLLKYLHSRVVSIHSDDEDPEPPIEIPNSYNPAKNGVAYYFSEKGLQIREGRTFSIDQNSVNETHDDIPTTSSCSKTYPIVAKGGTSFLFLWFCPIHGHCYGCHIVNGAEGRKDPAMSLLKYLEKAPSTVFYDFSCSLEEYNMNREAGYYRNTQFFHDVFHGYTLNCSSVYSSRGLQSLACVNSSICEQFNSFLQCIKASAKQMSQEHFMFFVQYMIHIWNKKKRESFSNKLQVALSGIH